MAQRIFAALLGVALLHCCPGIQAQEAPQAKARSIPELVREGRAAYGEGDFAAYRDVLLEMRKLRPNNSDYMYQTVLAHALLEDRSAAYELMLHMQRQGLSYDFNATEQSERIRGTQVYDHVNELLVRQGQPAGMAKQLFELPPNLLLPTAIAWDESRKVLLVGAAREGTVHAVGLDGEVRELLRATADNGLWGVFGLLVDVPNNRLWVTSAASPVTVGFDKADTGRSGLFEFTLDKLDLVRQYPVPMDGRPHRLAGLARTPAGDIFAVDTVLPIIYRLEAGADSIQPFVASGDMVSLRGIAISPDGNRVYVADYEMGIMILDLAQRRVSMLQVPATFNPGGIEGLLAWNDYLVVIQNGLKPQRIMRLELNETGDSVTGVAPLAVAQPEFDFPNFGTLVGDELVFLANSHWVRSMQGQPPPVRVASTNVSEAPELTTPDMEKFMEESRQRAAQEAAAPQEP